MPELALRKGTPLVKRPCHRAGRRGSLLARVSVGLIRRERTEVVPTAVGEEACQERRPVESLDPVFVRLEFPRSRREFRSHRVTSVEWTVPAGRLDHRQRDRRVRWWTTIAAGASAGAGVMAFSSQRPGLVSVRRSAEICNRRVLWCAQTWLAAAAGIGVSPAGASDASSRMRVETPRTKEAPARSRNILRSASSLS